MAYITLEAYTQYYGAPNVDAEEFARYAQIASDMIDTYTRFSIEQGGGIAALPSIAARMVELATGAQVLFMLESGGIESLFSDDDGAGFSVGRVRVDGGKGVDFSLRAAELIAPIARIYLEQSGLCGRGLAVFGC